MPRDDRGFVYLTADASTVPAIDFLTYGLYAFETFEWMRQREEGDGRAPDTDAVNGWIGDITQTRFTKLREQAAYVFENAARDYLSEDTEARKEAAVRTAILAEVKAAGAFWRQMTVALVTAILAPLIMGAVIAAALEQLQPD